MRKREAEIEVLSEGLWAVDLDDVSIEALERRFELAVGVVATLCEPICSPICSFCNPICQPIIQDP